MPRGVYNRISPNDRFMSFVEKTDTCWIWNGGVNSKGYGVFWANNKCIAAHRYSFENFKHIPSGFLLHSCDNPKCVNPEHLTEGTHVDNMKDMTNKNRQYHPKGSLNKMAKITLPIAEQIRSDYNTMLQKDIALKYNICQQTVSLIVNNKIWT